LVLFFVDSLSISFSSIGSQSFGDEADQEDNDVDDEDDLNAIRERDDQDQGNI
jgi:hypothetical protein